MILKLIPHHTANYKRLIEYVLKEGKGLNNAKPEAIPHNLRGTTVAEWVEQFQRAESFRLHARRDQVLLRHEVLSFNKLDSGNISKEILTDFANQYIQQRGIGGIYVVAIHQDTKSYHIHACVSGVRLDGMSSTLSKSQLKELKLNLQRYHQQKFPEIKHSNPHHGKGKEYLNDREYQAKQRNERTLHKDFVKETVTVCFAKAQSQQEFLTLIQSAGLHHYERNNKSQGVVYEGMKFRFSRFEIDIHRLPQISSDMKKEQTLEELRNLRESSEKATHEKSTLPKSLTAMQLNDIRHELIQLYAEKNGLFIQMTHEGFSTSKLSKDLDDIIRREAYLLSKEEELSKTLDSEKEPAKDEQKQEAIEHSLENLENNAPDIDANPELFDFDTEENIEISNEEEQELLNELDDLREEADRDEYDVDYDDDWER